MRSFKYSTHLGVRNPTARKILLPGLEVCCFQMRKIDLSEDMLMPFELCTTSFRISLVLNVGNGGCWDVD